MPNEVKERLRKPSPAKPTIEKLRSEGFVNSDNEIVLFKINGTGEESDFATVGLERFIGIRPAIINPSATPLDKIALAMKSLNPEEIKALIDRFTS